MTTSPLLELNDVRITLPIEGRERDVVRGVSFSIAAEEAVALVGESGSGKTMTARSILRLLPRGARTLGEINFKGNPVLSMTESELRGLRATEIGMIFQDPRAAINPVHTVGDFLTEGLVRLRSVSRPDAREIAIRLLQQIGVDRPRERLYQYPHELSGGILQRVMIASVLLMEPSAILADEPTTALDPTTQSEVLAILDEQRRQRGLSLLLITHNLELASSVCDRTLVMYAGSIVEDHASTRLLVDPFHPYSAALGASRPLLDRRLETLPAIPGQPIAAFESPFGCSFAPRCPFAQQACREEPQHLRDFEDGRVACRRAEELRGVMTARTADEPV